MFFAYLPLVLLRGTFSDVIFSRLFFILEVNLLARMYNCGICGGKHPAGEPCPHKYKFKKVSDVSQKANKFYRTKAWQMKRKEILERDKYCQRCWLKFGIVSCDHLEIHHIKPKCLDGTNDADNLVTLTLREHFICHKLLVHIYPNEVSLKYALWMICVTTLDAKKSVISGNITYK